MLFNILSHKCPSSLVSFSDSWSVDCGGGGTSWCYFIISTLVELNVDQFSSSGDVSSSSLTYPISVIFLYGSNFSQSSHLSSSLTTNPPKVLFIPCIHISNNSKYPNRCTIAFVWYGRLLPFWGTTYIHPFCQTMFQTYTW